MPATKVRWTEEDAALMLKLNQEGMTGDYIANYFTQRGMPCTRNSILGRIHRLRKDRGVIVIARPRRPPKPRAERPAVRVTQVQKRERTKVVYTVPPTIQPLHVTLMDLVASHCRFPTMGEGRHTRYCGLTRREDSSYCPYHHGVTHVQPLQT